MNAPLELVESCACKHGMRVRIDESRKHDFAGSIEFGRSLIGQVIRRANPVDDAITNRNRTIRNDAEFTQLRTAARARRSGYGQELARMNDIQFHGIWPEKLPS